MKMNGNLIGLSLSLCLGDVIRGRVNVEQIEKIVSSTRIANKDQLDEVIRDYRECYWSDDPDRAERIARALFSAGKVEQPRLVDNHTMPSHDNGIWVESADQVVLVHR